MNCIILVPIQGICYKLGILRDLVMIASHSCFPTGIVVTSLGFVVFAYKEGFMCENSVIFHFSLAETFILLNLLCS